MRVAPRYGKLVRMVMIIIAQLQSFMFLMSVMLMAFAVSFLLFASASATSSDGDSETLDRSSQENASAAILSNIGAGEIGASDASAAAEAAAALAITSVFGSGASELDYRKLPDSVASTFPTLSALSDLNPSSVYCVNIKPENILEHSRER